MPKADPSREPADDTAGFYAPPITQATVEQTPFTPSSPGLVGFFTVLATSFVSSLIASLLMMWWYEITPKGGGILAGLGEAIMAFLTWAALTAFAVLSGAVLASGLLSRTGRLSSAAWVLLAVFWIAAMVVGFLPTRSAPGPMRGLFGVLAEATSMGLTYWALVIARRKFIGPPPPPPWMTEGEL